jgi:hypothetical protein
MDTSTTTNAPDSPKTVVAVEHVNKILERVMLRYDRENCAQSDRFLAEQHTEFDNHTAFTEHTNVSG